MAIRIYLLPGQTHLTPVQHRDGVFFLETD